MKSEELKSCEKAIKTAISQLKDFQKSTVDYVYDQLYVKNRNKMLVADEVGLGKTIVAKGIIAKGFKKYLDDGGPSKENPTFNVVYICSNLAIARQNINKLNIFNYWGNDSDDPNAFVEATINRLVYLSYKPKQKLPPFLINSLTPGTSFDEKSSLGEADERAIIYRLLVNYAAFRNRGSGLKWILKGNIGTKRRFDDIIKWNKSRHKRIRNDLFKKFKDELRNTLIDKEIYPRLVEEFRNPQNLSLWEALLRISKRINRSNKNQFKSKSEIVRSLRRILSRLCLEYLGADIFILDEFQRFSNLIKFDQESENPAIELARSVFEIEEAKVLMLSATPFKPFTNDFDELNGEVHYKEFEAVLKFLMKNDPESLWEQFHTDRKAFFSILREIRKLNSGSKTVLEVKRRLESIYRKSMVRTERLLVSKEHDAMIKSVLKDQPLKMSKEDIEDFIKIDRIIQYLNDNYFTKLPIPLEYTKSSPFILSYLDNYQHKIKLERFAKEDEHLIRLLKDAKSSWLNKKCISEYKSFGIEGSNGIPNSKLRLLLEKLLYRKGWQYLWVPPTIQYSRAISAYKGSKGYSKCLVFSSWILVPRMIATIASYEAERLTVGNLDSLTGQEKINPTYFANQRTPRPQFTYKVDKEDQEPQRMISFSLLYPSVFLADLFDPASFAGQNKPFNEIKSQLKKSLQKQLRYIVDKYGTGSSDWQKWMWVAPLLLDKESANKRLIRDWFVDGIPKSDLVIDSEDESSQGDEQTGKQIHFNYAGESFLHPLKLKLPKLNRRKFEQLLEFLVNLSFGSPAICALRSIAKYSRVTKKSLKLSQTHLNAAFNISSGFITLFNKPESIAVIRLTTSKENYVDKVLEYSIDGNIQSMLDEYFYLLIDCENLKSTSELSNHICDILSIRTNTLQVDDLENFLKSLMGHKTRQFRVRTHFASDFINQNLKTATKNDRTINIRQAFNSPFRPFILASTSIGQEGLDFHLYCKKIFHWNLPSNAIDLEQREGRIHRYKGLVIRQNLVDKYLSELVSSKDYPIWNQIFKRAENEKNNTDPKCELSPYWHTESNSGIKIERFIPLYPYSRDIDRYKQILKILAYYRLTFGQPRQEELIDAIFKGNLDSEEKEQLQKLLINLSPVVFYNS